MIWATKWPGKLVSFPTLGSRHVDEDTNTLAETWAPLHVDHVVSSASAEPYAHFLVPLPSFGKNSCEFGKIVIDIQNLSCL